MGLRAAVKNKVTRTLFSIERRNAKRMKAEKDRLAQGAPHLVEYFHQADDPYSHLLMQVLPELCRRYDIVLKVHIVPPPPDWAAPDRERLEAYSRIDAARLAQRAGLRFSDPGQQPSSSKVMAANAALLNALASGSFLDSAVDISSAMWAGDLPSAGSPADAETQLSLDASAKRREDLGHYLGATIFYAGEWYWGIDRLHYLEQRLQALGAAKQAVPNMVYPPQDTATDSARQSIDPKPELHWYLSFRSPYTGIVADRVKALAAAYGADLKLRYVLPMVMRGMSVPRMKGFYIMSDVVREAERMHIPFGNAVDPVGEPVERGYAILEEAIKRGRGFEFAHSFLSGVWADGLDAGSNSGLRKITERAGLPWNEMRSRIGTDDWRPVAEANRQEMFKYEIWGVPSFRIGEVATWGQDRLWVIEDALNTLTDHEQGSQK